MTWSRLGEENRGESTPLRTGPPVIMVFDGGKTWRICGGEGASNGWNWTRRSRRICKRVIEEILPEEGVEDELVDGCRKSKIGSASRFALLENDPPYLQEQFSAYGRWKFARDNLSTSHNNHHATSLPTPTRVREIAESCRFDVGQRTI